MPTFGRSGPAARAQSSPPTPKSKNGWRRAWFPDLRKGKIPWATSAAVAVQAGERQQPKDAEWLIADMLQHLEKTRQEPLHVRKAVFRGLQRQLHPDKNADCEEAAKQAFQQLMQERAAYFSALAA